MASLLETLNAALAPVVRALSADLGCTVAIYRPVVATSADGSPSRVYAAPDPVWSNTGAFFAPGRGSGGGTDTIAKPFGVRTTAFGTLTFTVNADGVLPLVSPFDGFKILDGPFAGFTWLAEADDVPDPIGATCGVQIVSAPPGTIP